MMDSNIAWVLGSMFIAGLTASLHCVGMCGPIVVGFAKAFERVPLTIQGRTIDDCTSTPPKRVATDFVWYHAGRIWTYAMLGLVAGFAGQWMQNATDWLGWQRSVSIAISVCVIITGVLLLGVIPSAALDRVLGRCASKRFVGRAWFDALKRSQGVAARLLLGAVMGLLPCGLVYAMLIVVAAFGNPLLSALGMVGFGLGTLPSLTAAVMAARLLPQRWFAHGSKATAAMMIAVGVWMAYRSATVTSPDACPFCNINVMQAAEPHTDQMTTRQPIDKL